MSFFFSMIFFLHFAVLAQPLRYIKLVLTCDWGLSGCVREVVLAAAAVRGQLFYSLTIPPLINLSQTHSPLPSTVQAHSRKHASTKTHCGPQVHLIKFEQTAIKNCLQREIWEFMD